MSYKLLRNSSSVLRLADSACIPPDSGNADYQAFQAWVAKGNAPLPAEPVPPPTQDEIDTAAAKTHAKLAALAAMTPAQVQAWIEANVTAEASVKDLLKTYGVLLCILARRL